MKDNMYYGLQSQKPDLSEEVFNRIREDHFFKLEDHSKNWIEIERDTRDQADSELWKTIRKDMLTASNFGVICRMRESTSCANVVKGILYPPLTDNVALKFGRENEEKARECLSKKMKKQIVKCGLFIDREICYLGASPDGLLDDDGLVEIKCPFSAQNMSAEEAINTITHLKRIFHQKSKKLEMNIIHPYYYQVQGQLHITQRAYCMFVIWTPKSIVSIRVNRDDGFWEREMKAKLIRFYEHCLLPEILDSRYNRNMPIRDPSYILNAKEKALNAKEEKGKSDRKRKLKEKETSTFDASIDDSFSSIGEEDECIITNVCSSEEIALKKFAFLDAANAPLQDIEKNVLSINGKLNDDSLDKFLKIIRATTDFETQSVLYIAYPNFVEASKGSPSLQIIGGNSTDHWRCVFFDGCKLYIYDSLPSCSYEKLSNEERKYIALRYPFVRETEFVYPKVHIQPDVWSCGIYSAAFATTIALGCDPSQKIYSNDVALMRSHFFQIIKNNKLEEFPDD